MNQLADWRACSCQISSHLNLPNHKPSSFSSSVTLRQLWINSASANESSCLQLGIATSFPGLKHGYSAVKQQTAVSALGTVYFNEVVMRCRVGHALIKMEHSS